MTTKWITDDNGNRASVERWGSEKAARASLETLVSCVRCENCVRCVRCVRCVGCENCRGCVSCVGCDLTKPNRRLPVSDPRGYTWLAIVENGAWRIRAGCRLLSIAEARKHWLSDDYKGPETVKETVGFALDWIEGKASPSLGRRHN